jgi:hypothetical protein
MNFIYGKNDTVEQWAAENLIHQAMDSKNRSMALFLIGAACKLDSSLSADDIFSTWRESWLQANQNRSK